MSLLNIALQNCAMESGHCYDVVEEAPGSWSSSTGVRQLCGAKSYVAKKWASTAQPLQQTIPVRSEWAKMKDQPVHTQVPTADKEIK